MLFKQSKTLNVATKEYTQRYIRSLPPGFDKWFQFAKAQKLPLIDNFNSIDKSLWPYWEMSSDKLCKTMKKAYKVNDVNLLKFSFIGEEFESANKNWLMSEICSLVSTFAFKIPSTQVLLNRYNELKVMLSKREKPFFHHVNHNSTWDINSTSWTSRQSLIRRALAQDVQTHGLLFIKTIQDVIDSKDLCLHPEYKNMHGMLHSVTTYCWTGDSVLMLSQARLFTNNDVLYPSSYYTVVYSQSCYSEDKDPSWEKKQNNVYWAGFTTGSWDQGNESEWRHLHRQRFVTLANNLDLEAQHSFLAEKTPDMWHQHTLTNIFLQLYDAKFTTVIQCKEPACQQQKAFFEVAKREPTSQAYWSRFVFNLDGNSFSRRFYSLLSSRSVVLKQTLFKKWHDDRLVPWVHYVPVSLKMKKLSKTMRYLVMTKKKAAVSMRIVKQKRKWQQKTLRREDVSVYLYWLLLKWARLLNENRSSGAVKAEL